MGRDVQRRRYNLGPVPSAHLTVRNITTLEAIGGKSTEWWDDALPGFYLRVSPPSQRYPQGVRSYGLWYRVRRKAKRTRFGRHPRVGLADARARAREILLAAGLRGEDLADDAPGISNLVDLVRAFIAASRKQTPRIRGDKTLAEYERLVETYLVKTAAAALPVRDVTRRDLRELLRPRAAAAPVQTERVRMMLKTAFGWALDEDPPLVEKDPTRGLEVFAEETSRERTLRDDEIGILWRACLEDAADEWHVDGGPGRRRRRRQAAEIEGGRQRGALARLILLTGARPGEAQLMDWPELEAAARLWHVPPEHRKGQRGKARAHVFPVSTLTLEVLEELEPDPRRRRGRVFGWTAGDGVYDPHWHEPLYRRAKRLGLVDHWTPHDLRRTCATGISRLGYSRATIAIVLGHANREGGGSTGTYDRFDRMPERVAALDAWSAHVCNLVGA